MIDPVRRGRPPLTDETERVVRVPWSMRRRLIERVRQIADERGVPYSMVATEMIERGLVEHDIRQAMERVA
jgi:transposase